MHGGAQAVAAARRHGVSTMFTLSGGHVFPVYDGAVTADPPMPIIDVRHEQTAVFAAEATARLTRSPGFAVLTAGPGVTNGISGITSAHFNGSPLVVLAGRAPDGRWGSGSLQELDHPPLLAPVTKRAWTEHVPGQVGAAVADAFALAGARHRGPVFLDVSLEAMFGVGDPVSTVSTGGTEPGTAAGAGSTRGGPDPDAIAAIARLLAGAIRPVLILGSDVWLDGAEHAARAAAQRLQLPVVANGQGRGILPAGHPLLVTRARSVALGEADLVLVAGTPLDFRLGYGQFGGRNGTAPARVVQLADAVSQLATHCTLAGAAWGQLAAIFGGLADATEHGAGQPAWAQDWLPRLRAACASATAADEKLLHSDSRPIHPLRIYGELAALLGPAAGTGRAAARRRRRRILPDGRRHASPAPASGSDDLRQQRDLGPGEAPHAGLVRL